jgi:DNA primase
MSQTQEIKTRLDIVDFIREYIELKSAGTNFKGLCPFHNEKSPSFMVNRDRQSFKCFGCGKGGDIFSFVQEIEGMEFVEALRLLADKAGVELETSAQAQAASSERNRIKAVLKESARFYHHFLVKMDASQEAREYLEQRGVGHETIVAWQIGFIPDQWDLLTKYLLKKGHAIDDLVAAGVTIKRDQASTQTYKGFYDRFRGRIMFPICDVHGTVVGFTGRVLVETEKSGGKYVNTPQSPVFDKSQVLFGLSHAKQYIRDQKQAILVEGQMDVISCHAHGSTNVVASSGTALTAQQITLLKRYTDQIAMAFDQDAAGRKAAKRGIDLAIEAGLDVRVIQIPEGKGGDPDECIRDYPDVWKQAVAQAVRVMDWYITNAIHGRDLSDPRQKQAAADEVLPEIARIPYAIEQDHWLQQCAVALGIDAAILRKDLARFIPKKATQSALSHRPAPQKNTETTTTDTPKQSQMSPIDVLVQNWFALLFMYPAEISFQAILDERPFLASREAALYEQLKMIYSTSDFQDISLLKSAIDPSHHPRIDELLLRADWEFGSLSAKERQETSQALLDRISSTFQKQKRQELQAAIAAAEAQGDHTKLTELLTEFQQFLS